MENETFWIHRLYAAALWHFLYRQHALSAALALLQWNFVSHQRLCPNCLQLMCHWKAKYGFIKSFPPDLFQTQKRTILSANAPHQTMRLLFGSGVMLRYTLGNTAQRASGDFARHLLANFQSYFTKMLVNTSSIHSAFCFIWRKIWRRIYRTIFVRYCLYFLSGSAAPQAPLSPPKAATLFSISLIVISSLFLFKFPCCYQHTTHFCTWKVRTFL